jgi:hypothetical protein
VKVVEVVIHDLHIGPLLLRHMRQQSTTAEQINEYRGVGEQPECLLEFADKTALLPHERQRGRIVNKFLHSNKKEYICTSHHVPKTP